MCRLALGLMTLVCLSGSIAVGASDRLRANDFHSQLRFGAEWTMSSDELLKSFPSNGNEARVTSDLGNQKIDAMAANLRKKYARSPKSAPVISRKSFHSRWKRGAFELKYPDGFGMTVFSDPGVIEVNSVPSSQADIEKNLHRIQSDIFDNGRAEGLAPALFTGSGHIHIEVSKLHPETVRNFLADFYNHTGLAAGALNEDIYNSLGAGEMPEGNKLALRQAFKRFDRQPEKSTDDLVNWIGDAYDIPYNQDLPDYKKARNSKRAKKYFAISFRSFFELGTVEIRSIRPQMSAESYLKLVRLFVKRMELAEAKRLRGENVAIGELPSMRGKAREVIADFEHYVTEAGLDIEDYREFVLPWWQQPGAEFDQVVLPKKCQALF